MTSPNEPNSEIHELLPGSANFLEAIFLMSGRKEPRFTLRKQSINFHRDQCAELNIINLRLESNESFSALDLMVLMLSWLSLNNTYLELFIDGVYNGD